MGYRPRIMNGSSHYDLPMPIMQFSERLANRVTTSEVPLQQGVIPTAKQKDAIQITVSGAITVGNPQDSTRTDGYTQVGMVSDIELEKRLMIDALMDQLGPFVFYRYISGALLGGVEVGDTAKTIWYKDCFCLDLSFDRTNRTKRVLPYSFTLLVPDGTDWWYP